MHQYYHGYVVLMQKTAQLIVTYAIAGEKQALINC